MGFGPAMLAGVIPVGPLHPTDATVAFGFGLLVASAVVPRMRAWAVAVALGAVGAFEYRHSGELVDGVFAHGAGIGGWVAALGVVGAGLVVHRVGRGNERPAVFGEVCSAIAACALVWGIVPDTEAPLMFGAALMASLLVASLTDAAWRSPSRVAIAVQSSAVIVLPVVAALVGSRGRTSRLWPALTAIVLVSLAFGVAHWWRERWVLQRAGTPTTVAPGATSPVTTAPAPTTAP